MQKVNHSMSQTTTARKSELERSLGLRAALTIGIGTMVGAGIFVFPGLAAGRAGPAAMLSFALGALIALLVALSASELATAIPRSGGAYYFVAEGLGRFPGALVGISQWLGLIFASAFYLTGFGSYVLRLLQEFGLSFSQSGVFIALVAAVLLTAVNITGTENMGRLQNGIVLTLLVILVVFLGYGILSALGVIGESSLPETFMPFGVSPVFSTTALVFTSYLGFVQIANVAGEIRRPGRNLPWAMVGSVLVVGLLYVATIFVSTTVFGNEKLASLGQTAIVEVARTLFGRFGAIVLLGAGLLATLSSANASILSSSRSVYALGRAHIAPPAISTISEQFSTPYYSLLATGIPIALLTLLGRVETLAEVASFLHLIIYGLICVTLLWLRRRSPEWYEPEFRAPGYPWLPGVGALVSFGLIAFMEPLSMIIGAAVLLLAAVWYWSYARENGE